MCTVVTRRVPGSALQVLAIRDEFVGREFDDPGEWWPDHPGVVGGRDRVAGGSWCVSDVATGVTALVLNRTERHTGAPSRGILPLAAVRYGAAWTDHVDHGGMASFTLVLSGPQDVTAWTWDATDLVRHDLPEGLHVFTPAGVDADTEKSTGLTASLSERAWFDVVTAAPPRDDRSALIVRHQLDDAVYATVFGQLITSVPGALDLRYSRTPWRTDAWAERTFERTAVEPRSQTA